MIQDHGHITREQSSSSRYLNFMTTIGLNQRTPIAIKHLIWAAAGHPNSVFQLAPPDLEWLTGAPVADVAVGSSDEKSALQYAMNVVAAHAHSVRSVIALPSPCISVCRINSNLGLCEGCFRTTDEIAAWGSSNDNAKRATWGRIEERIAALRA